MSERRVARVVGDLMAHEPIVVRDDAMLDEAAVLMESRGISGLPVVDPAGALVGVISRTDLVRARAIEQLWGRWPALHVRHLVTAPAITVLRGTPLALAARRMDRHLVHRLVVVADEDPSVPIGILSASDLVRAMSVHGPAHGARNDVNPGEGAQGITSCDTTPASPS